MKGALAVLGVIVVGAAAYFMARGKQTTTPTPVTGKVPVGKQIAQQAEQKLATNLLTSDNVAKLGGLLNSVLPQGGAAKVAPMAGNGSGFTTQADLNKTYAPTPAPAPVDNTFVTSIQDDSSEDYSG
jgi:hypothetical protein